MDARVLVQVYIYINVCVCVDERIDAVLGKGVNGARLGCLMPWR